MAGETTMMPQETEDVSHVIKESEEKIDEVETTKPGENNKDEELITMTRSEFEELMAGVKRGKKKPEIIDETISEISQNYIELLTRKKN